MPVSIEDLRVTRDSLGQWHRNIVSLRETRDLFASLVDDEDEARIVMEHEITVKPYLRFPSITQRPFEFAEVVESVAEAISWPFDHPAESRFSGGRFGCWYGAGSLETSIFETGFHFWQDLNDSEATRRTERVVNYRRVHLVTCTGDLFDLRPAIAAHPGLYDHGSILSACRALGEEAHGSMLPGFLTYSARDPRDERGLVAAVFNPDLLSDPGVLCYLIYRLDNGSGELTIERTQGQVMLQFRPADLSNLR